MTKGKAIIFSTVLIDVLGFGIVIPILPFYVTEFGVPPSTVTLLFASFSFFSFLSAPLLGAISDRIGRRPVLILSIASTAAGWFVFASATSVAVLFLGRIIDGIAAGNFTIAQSYIVDVSRNEEDRTRSLGLLSAVFGLGFLLGPIAGGILSTVSHSFPFWAAGCLALGNGVIAILFLPESHRNREGAHPLTVNPLGPIGRAARDRQLRPLYVTWLMFALAFVTGQSVFSLFVRDVFGMNAFQAGMLFAAIGVVVVLNQTLLLNRFWMKRFTMPRLTVLMLSILALALLLIGTEVLPLFFLALVGLGTGQAVLRVVVTTQVAGTTGTLRKGETLGILSAIMSASMVVAPVIAGYLFEIDHAIPYFLASGFIVVALIEMMLRKPSAAEGHSRPST